MLKILPIGAVLLVAVGTTTYAQNGTGSNMTNPGSSATPDTSTVIDTSNPDTSNGATPSTTTTTTDTVTGTTSPVTATPVNTITTTPVTTDVTSPSTTSTVITNSSSDTTSAGTAPTTFTCSGSTPSWNSVVSKNMVTYNLAANSRLRFKSITSMTPVGDTSGRLQVFSMKDAYGKPISFVVRKNDTGCTNAAGSNFQYDAYILFSNKIITGCCNPS